MGKRRNLLLLLWLYALVSLPSSLKAGVSNCFWFYWVEETIVITEAESIEYEADGIR